LLPSYSDNTFQFTQEAVKLVRQLYRVGVAYKKAGVLLFDLSSKQEYQLDLFEQPSEKGSIMQVMDQINKKWGRGTIHTAACGTTRDWRMLCEKKSQKTQTSWSDLVEVGAE
jgi:DNA polymerase V